MVRRAHPRAGAELLVGSALGAVNTLNARKSLRRHGMGGAVSFFAGWLTSELPLHTIALQVIGTLRLAGKGALRSKAGLAGLAFNVASWVALAAVDRQARRQGPIFDRALEEAFGHDVAGADTDQVARLVEAEPVVMTRRRVAVGPLTRYRRRYVRTDHGNVAYGPAGRRNTLDIWRRPDLPSDAEAPVLVQVHGGGWVVGNKQQQAMPLMAHLCDRGWVCVSINYRLSPRATWPDHIVDVKRALAWVKANIAAYGGDPGFVAITGGSAGGHLTSLAALSPNEPAFQPGFEDADTSVAAAVPFYGVYDWTNRDGTGRADMIGFLAERVLKVPVGESPVVWDGASPMSWVNPAAPPMFIVHGTNDSLVPVEQARSFVAMLRTVSTSPVAYAELPGTQHAFEIFDSPRTMLSAGAVTRFLETVRRSRQPASDAPSTATSEPEPAVR